ncbi:HNH endonuclease [Mycolicibacterium goodii]|uniref:HNH endonuclease signature motif containing protein n=1 Tax=Mycolicibacterium goodii TaxID=134601 RepID=UPI001F0472CB|nr:HNH endonuclease signature motif containing protein [Mycolicibacterium goodii]ULN47981.1 HNH endonuclease [Mycolicibacterium goodii]
MFDGSLAEIAELAALDDAELQTHARAWAQVEAAACARKHAVMAELFIRRTHTDDADERRWWFVDPEAAVGAQRGVALRDRLPKVNDIFAAGLISEQLVRNICWSTMLMLEPDKLAAIDAELAAQITGWGRLTQKQIDNTIDDLILKHDPGAFGRGRASRRSRYFDIGSPGDAPGVLSVNGRLDAPVGAAFDALLTELAHAVCPEDPRTLDQRRHDAINAILTGTTLACRCEDPDCARGREHPPRGHLVLHAIAPQSTVTAAQEAAAAATGARAQSDDAHAEPTATTPEDAETDCDAESVTVTECTESSSDTPSAFAAPAGDALDHLPPAVLFGGGVLPAYALAEIINAATVRPVFHPGDAPPQDRYTPSRALADYVRCRDLICRFPGCDKPADRCDIDHTVPYPAGPTHASNLKCLCRFHQQLAEQHFTAHGTRSGCHRNLDRWIQHFKLACVGRHHTVVEIGRAGTRDGDDERII